MRKQTHTKSRRDGGYRRTTSRNTLHPRNGISTVLTRVVWAINISRFQILLSSVLFRTRGRSVREEWTELARTPGHAFGMMKAGSHFGATLGSLLAIALMLPVARLDNLSAWTVWLRYWILCVPLLCGLATEVETRLRAEWWDRPGQTRMPRDEPVHAANLVNNRMVLIRSSVAGIVVAAFAGYVLMMFDPLGQV